MKIIGNILGDMYGQLGKKIVAFQWKGIDVFRTYVIPNNPKTDSQQQHRNFFASVVRLASSMLDDIINVFWLKYAKKMTAFNAFIKENMNSMTSATDWPNLILCKGSLYFGGITAAGKVGTKVNITFNSDPGGNGADDDLVMAAVYDTSKNRITLANSPVSRSSGTIEVNLGYDFTASNVRAYAFAYRNLKSSDPDLSYSSYSAVTSG